MRIYLFCFFLGVIILILDLFLNLFDAALQLFNIYRYYIWKFLMTLQGIHIFLNYKIYKQNLIYKLIN